MRRLISRSISVVPGRRVEGIDGDVALGTRHEGVESSRLLSGLEQRRDHFVRPGREPAAAPRPSRGGW